MPLVKPPMLPPTAAPVRERTRDSCVTRAVPCATTTAVESKDATSSAANKRDRIVGLIMMFWVEVVRLRCPLAVGQSSTPTHFLHSGGCDWERTWASEFRGPKGSRLRRVRWRGLICLYAVVTAWTWGRPSFTTFYPIVQVTVRKPLSSGSASVRGGYAPLDRDARDCSIGIPVSRKP